MGPGQWIAIVGMSLLLVAVGLVVAVVAGAFDEPSKDLDDIQSVVFNEETGEWEEAPASRMRKERAQRRARNRRASRTV